MRSVTLVALAGLLNLGSFAEAQMHKGHEQGAQTPPAPYSGMEQRSIKALSAQQAADLRAGRGMGLALAAELNGYPGPSHSLELAEVLSLTDAQRIQATAMFDAMKAETIPIGERILAQEEALDRLFADAHITPAQINAATAQIAAAQGELRAAHLRYHIAMRDLLTPSQIALYAERRGYRTR